MTSTRVKRTAGFALVGLAAVALGGCCSVPKRCCEQLEPCSPDAIYTVTITIKGGECVVKPDETTTWVLHPGTKIKFVNATANTVTVKPSFGAYEGVGELGFTVESYDSVLKTVATPGPDPNDHIILHTVECGGDDHGGPKMVVTDPPEGSGSG